MPAKPLTPIQIQEAQALKNRFNVWKADNKKTQEDALEPLGFGQSALSQYLNGRIPLNPDAAWKFAQLLGCEVGDFSPSIADHIKQLPYRADRDHQGGAIRRQELRSTTGSSQVDEGEPVQPTPTLGTTILQLGALLAALSPMGQKTIAALVEEVLKDPSKAKEAAETADAIARTQRIPVRDESISRSFGRAQESPVETGLTPLE